LGGAQAWRGEGEGAEQLTRAWWQRLWHGEAVLARPQQLQSQGRRRRYADEHHHSSTARRRRHWYCEQHRARSVSEAHTSTARARAHRRSPNRPRRFSTRSREEAIRQERKQSEKPRGQIDRSSRGGPDQVGGGDREARRWPERGGGHGGDAIATGVARGLGLGTSE
jgi:hypothetical protein